MTHPLEQRLTSFAPVALTLFRVVLGLLFTVHGASKLFAWPIDMGGGALPVGSFPGWWSGLIELVAGVLIMSGLFTRIAAFISSGMMAVAYFWKHQPEALHPLENGGESAVLFCFGFFLLVFTGGGAYALDSMLGRRRTA